MHESCNTRHGDGKGWHDVAHKNGHSTDLYYDSAMDIKRDEKKAWENGGGNRAE
jgi:hypothetical protein